MQDIKLTDLIDIATLQEIQDGFADLTGMAALITDENGDPVTRESNFTDFCMNYTRSSHSGRSKCEECNKAGGEQAMRSGCASAYFCHAGLVDFAAPILLNGKLLGSFVGGQVLTEEPDEENFRRIAVEIGVDPDEYIAALKKVRIVDKKQIDAAADFMFTISKVLSQTAYNCYSANQSKNGVSEINQSIIKKIGETELAIIRAAEKIKELSDAFENIDRIAGGSASEVSATTGTVKVIQNIALNTKILGFNASIEASRAKESGKGFGVIAQEVRSLAETSKRSADLIEKAMQKIGAYSKDMDAQVSSTRSIIDRCLADMENISASLGEIKTAAEE